MDRRRGPAGRGPSSPSSASRWRRRGRSPQRPGRRPGRAYPKLGRRHPNDIAARSAAHTSSAGSTAEEPTPATNSATTPTERHGQRPSLSQTSEPSKRSFRCRGQGRHTERARETHLTDRPCWSVLVLAGLAAPGGCDPVSPGLVCGTSAGFSGVCRRPRLAKKPAARDGRHVGTWDTVKVATMPVCSTLLDARRQPWMTRRTPLLLTEGIHWAL